MEQSNLYLMHQCCQQGLLAAKKWQAEHENVQRIIRKSLFQVKAEGLDKKYGFILESLYKNSYLCDDTKILVTF